jgi:multiple antibiotic resistance protein
MQFSIPEIFLILLVVAGATKGASFFASAGATLSMAERRAVILKAVVTQAIILFAFAFFGQRILGFFHVSIGALEIAGGLILLIFAIGLVLGEEHKEEEGKPAGDFSIYPLAVPLMASPQAIVATVVIFAKAPDFASKLNGYIALALLLLVNVVILMLVARAMGDSSDKAKEGSAVANVLLRVVAILLAALAIELIVLGLREYGIIAAAGAVGAH